jgi:hypothetical protein
LFVEAASGVKNMVPDSVTKPQAAIGILVMDARIRRIAGDVGNPATLSLPGDLPTVAGATLKRLIRERDPSLLPPFVEAGWELVRQGARALSTTCGFMVLFQQELAAEFPVPVFTSSLLQLPFIERSLRPRDRIGILTADAVNLTPEHLRRAGGDENGSRSTAWRTNPVFMRPSSQAAGGSRRQGGIRGGGAGERMVYRTRRFGHPAGMREPSTLRSCSQEAVRLPVYDFTTMLQQVQAALVRTPFASSE